MYLLAIKHRNRTRLGKVIANITRHCSRRYALDYNAERNLAVVVRSLPRVASLYEIVCKSITELLAFLRNLI